MNKSALTVIFMPMIYIGAAVIELGLMSKSREVMSTQTRQIDRPSFEATNISKVGLFMKQFRLLIVVGFWSRMI